MLINRNVFEVSDRLTIDSVMIERVPEPMLNAIDDLSTL